MNKNNLFNQDDKEYREEIYEQDYTIDIAKIILGDNDE